MKLHSVLWIEDDPDTRRIMLESFSEDREERGFNIMPHEFESWKDFTDNSDIDLSMISMALVCVDYNLHGGINGNDVIKIIRSYPANVDVNIIFYSYSKNEEELKTILEKTLGKNNMANIYFAHQDDLEDRIILLLEDL